MQLITVKESHNISDLVVLKSKLESEGISCYLQDELTAQVLNHLPAMTVKLRVAVEDLEKVREIFEASGEKLGEDETLICPKCGSKEIKVKLSLKNLFKICVTFCSAIVSIAPVGNIYEKSDFKCKTCNYKFSNK